MMPGEDELLYIHLLISSFTGCPLYRNLALGICFIETYLYGVPSTDTKLIVQKSLQCSIHRLSNY